MGQKKIKSVVIDTNVLISALLFGGTPGRLMPLWKKGQIRPFVSKEIVDEYLRILAYPKFTLSNQDINYLLHFEILPWFEVVTPEHTPGIITDDPSDDMFIHCALSGKAAYIISGDRHLLSLRTYKKIKILSPSAFLSLPANKS